MNRKRLKTRILRFASAAAVGAAVACVWLLHDEKPEQLDPAKMVRVEQGKGTVVLETTGGVRYAVDTLSNLYLAQERVTVAAQEALLQWRADSGSAEATKDESAWNRVTVPFAATYAVVLPDGTKISLNSGSWVEFPSAFGNGERRVRASGEVYCEVARDELHPFVLTIGSLNVRVLGTEFNVKAYDNEPVVYTTLAKGSVRVEKGDLQADLHPGEMARYDKAENNMSVVPADVEEQTAWRNGLFYFKDLPLEEILRRIARWYDLEVFYASQSAGGVVFNGKIPMYDGVEDVLRKFEYAGGVRFELKGRALTVYKK